MRACTWCGGLTAEDIHFRVEAGMLRSTAKLCIPCLYALRRFVERRKHPPPLSAQELRGILERPRRDLIG